MHPEEYNWSEANIENIQIKGKNIVVIACISGTNDRYQFSYIGVQKTSRTVTEYIGDPKDNPDFKETYVVEDIQETDKGVNGMKYYIEGITTFNPIAWLDWEIVAINHEVESIE